MAERLVAFEVRTLDAPGLRDAAVAIVVTTGTDGPGILMTQRPARMDRHAGQYALPGGKVDPGETARDAAFRELHEELGLDLAPERLLGRLDDYPTRSGFRIQPFVLWGGEGLDLRPDPGEVARVFNIPFNELESDAIPLLAPGEEEGHPVLYSDFPSVGTQMFAPTAAIVYQFREVCLLGRETRVAQYDQPRFAWT